LNRFLRSGLVRCASSKGVEKELSSNLKGK